MKTRLSYILLMAGLVFGSCSDEMYMEEQMLKDERIKLSGGNSLMITKSGLEYENFEEGTKYLLYGVETGKDWTAENTIMNRTAAEETSKHLIRYGETDLHFKGKTYDFYGATVCSIADEYPVDNTAAGNSPLISLSIEGDVLDDLMYSNNLKGCTNKTGLLQMNFIHALSKIQIEVAKQNDDPEIANARIHRITLKNTSINGTLDIAEGKWTLGEKAERVFCDAPGSPLSLTTSATMVKDASGEDAHMLVFPNEDGSLISVEVVYSLDAAGTETKTVECPVYRPNSAETPFSFVQNHRYTLSVSVANSGVQVVTVLPKVYDWIGIDVPSYLGQPVTFGNLMWMDRNLGAISADYENDWYNTIGHYFQFGRNVPYIMDVEKFKTYVAEDKGFQYTLPDDPSNLFDKLYVMYYDADNLYNNINTNMLLNECLYRFHSDSWTDEATKNAHIRNMVECIYTVDHNGDRVHGIQLVKESDEHELVRFPGYFWGAQISMSDDQKSNLYKFGYGGKDLTFPTVWTFKGTKGAAYWDLTKDDPCPKGWRLPSREDLEVLMPTIPINWDNVKNQGTGEFVDQNYPKTATTATEDIRYGKTADGNHICFVMKNKGKNDAYRLRITSHYVPDGKNNKRYFSISRYSVSKKTGEDGLYNEDLSHYLDGSITPTSKETTMWANPIETIKYPACGFIVPDSDVIGTDGKINWSGTLTSSARPDLRSFGFGTVLRTSDVYEKDEAGNIVNDYNYVQYLSTTDYQLGIQKLSRRSLGDQIRCVRDINAVD